MFDRWVDRASLHEIVDSLPESELRTAGRFLAFLLSESDPAPLTEEELAGVQEAIESLDRGEYVTHQEVGDRLGRWVAK